MIQILLLPVVGLFALQVFFFVFVGKRQTHIPTEEDVRLLKRLRWIGVGVMAWGVIAGSWIYRHSPAEDKYDPDIIGYEIGYGYSTPVRASQSKKAAVAEEKLGGKFGVILGKVEPWFVDQWHGRKLATTVVVLSGAVFLGCFLWARILTFPARSEQTP